MKNVYYSVQQKLLYTDSKKIKASRKRKLKLMLCQKNVICLLNERFLIQNVFSSFGISKHSPETYQKLKHHGWW